MKILRQFVFGALMAATIMVPYHFASAGDEPPKWCDAAGTIPPPCKPKPTTTVVKTTLPEVTTTVPDTTTSTEAPTTSTTVAVTTTTAAPSTTEAPSTSTTAPVSPPQSLRGPEGELPRTGAPIVFWVLIAGTLVGLGFVLQRIAAKDEQ